MNNILKNSWTLFTRNKEYFSTIVLTPIFMLLIFSFVLSFRSKVNIAFINLDKGELGELIENTIYDMDFLNPFTIDLDAIEQNIINDKIDLAIIVEKNASESDSEKDIPVRIIKAKDSTLADFIGVVLNSKIQQYKMNTTNNIVLSQNDVPRKGVPVTNALGIIIFKMIGSGSLLAGLIIAEKNTGIRNRIYMSKTKLSTYLFGRGSVFFVHLLLFSLIYFVTGKLFHFDFGMRYPTQIIVIFGILGIFTTAVGLMLAAFINDENMVWNFGVLILLPTSILSGALFPFSSMPKSLQILGNIFPQRWIMISIEKLQKGGMLTDTLFPLSGVFVLSIIMFIVASIRINKSKA